MTPCTPIASTYPLHENIDFTAPEVTCQTLEEWAIANEYHGPGLYLWARSPNPCSCPPIDYDLNPCTQSPQWRADSPVFPWELCAESAWQDGFARRYKRSRCWESSCCVSIEGRHCKPCDTK